MNTEGFGWPNQENPYYLNPPNSGDVVDLLEKGAKRPLY